MDGRCSLQAMTLSAASARALKEDERPLVLDSTTACTYLLVYSAIASSCHIGA